MSIHFKVIIPSYNSVKWIRKTLDSVSRQTHRDYEVCVIDDASTQEGQREIIEEYSKKYGWKTIFRQQNRGALANIVDGIKQLNPVDEDVIVLLDGDDWLYNKKALAKVAAAYQAENVQMTCGQFVTYPRWQLGFSAPLSKELLAKKNFREVPFTFSHLRTFKHKIWKQIKEEDFKDEKGDYFKTAWDLALIYPMLEMTGGSSCKFIHDILYVYNMDNPLNDCIAHAQLQAETANYIRSKQPYRQLYETPCALHPPPFWREMHNRWITIYRKFITPKVYKLAVVKLKRLCTTTN